MGIETLNDPHAVAAQLGEPPEVGVKLSPERVKHEVYTEFVRFWIALADQYANNPGLQHVSPEELANKIVEGFAYDPDLTASITQSIEFARKHKQG